MGRPAEGDRRTVAGRYVLLGRLGAGGMGTVWRAEDSVLGREVAVKEIVFPHGLPDEEREVLRERTRREARAAARLDHPSAVTVYDVVEQDGQPFLVMELVEARTLAEVVRSDGPLSPQRTAEVGLAVLGALEAAHARGIVHRDVKPGNVLLAPGPDGALDRVVLTDFGIATSSGDASITSTGLILGSPSYIAPERCRGQQPAPPSDLWSLGATLFTAVEGRPAYDAGDPLATVTAVVTGDHAPYRSAGPLQPVIEGLLERDPAARLGAPEARRALDAVARGSAGATRTGAAAAGAGAATAAAASAGARAERTAALPVSDLREAARAGTPEQPAAAPTPAATAPPAAPPAAPPELPAPPPAATAGTGPSRPVRPARPSRPVREPRRRSAAVPLALAAALVLAALVGGVLLLTGDREGSPSAAPGADPAVEAPAGPGPDPDPTGQPTADPTQEPEQDVAVERPEGVPADWEQYTHPEQGWTLFHPAAFAVSDRGTLKQFRDDSRRYTLRVDFTETPRPSALQAWQEASPGFAQRLADYQELRLEQVDYRGYDAADLEFTYTDGGARLRVLDRTFVVDGRGYALYWQVSADNFEASLDQFERLAAAFVPAP